MILITTTVVLVEYKIIKKRLSHEENTFRKQINNTNFNNEIN
jgi:hypothetical protein